jgi:hypothetical protein
MKTLGDWTQRLTGAAISDVDRRAVVASESARELVLERLAEGFDGHDVLHAWGALGRVLADASASPSLVAQVVDALVEAAPEKEKWAAPARAALIEAFVAAQREIEELRVAEAWRFPRCVVRLDEKTAAVAACFPDDDPDALSRWADEVAAGLAKMGVRRVHVDGTARGRAALADALSIAAIDLVRTRF